MRPWLNIKLYIKVNQLSDVKKYKYPDGFTPYAHQIETIKFMLVNKRMFLLSAIGTGKTACCLLTMDILFYKRKINRVLIVSPLSTLQSVWKHELFKLMPWVDARIAHGSRSVRVKAIRSNCQVVIINTDGITIMEEELIKAKFDIIVIDEVTTFKNSQAKRSKAMQRVAKTVPSVFGLSGNPTPNKHMEAFGVCKVVNPFNPYLPKYMTKFRQMVETQIGPFLSIPTSQADSVVFKCMQPAIRFTRDECLDLPPCQFEDIVVPMDSNHLKIYNEMKDELLYEYAEGSITSSNAAVKFSKLLQIASGSVKNDDGEVLDIPCKARDDEMLRIFDETGREKLIVFCAFRAGIEHLLKLYKNFKVDTIHGGVSQKNRGNILRRFTEGNLQILILQPQAASHGLNLQNCCTIIWHSLIASGELYEQCNGRIVRSGQTRKQLIFHIISSKAAKPILSLLKRKATMSKTILNLFADI